MAVATILASAVHQPLDLALGEIASLDCQVYDGWCAFLGSRFHADKPCLRGNNCLAYTDSHKGRIGRIKRIGIAMQMEGGRVRMRRRHEPRGWACAEGPPVGGTFQFQIFIQTPSPEIWSETISGS